MTKQNIPLAQFSEAGHGVFMLHRIVRHNMTGEAVCDCGNPKCDNAGKHPVAANWQRRIEWDADQLENFTYLVGRNRGYGILCENLLVIDVDVRNGGAESLERLMEEFPAIAGAGMIVETGRKDGSRHYYFTLDKSIRIKQNPKGPDKKPIYPGIDFKHSGYVVGPGSLHKAGNIYTIVSGSIDEIEDAPAKLVDFLKYEPVIYEHNGENLEVSDEVLASLLDAISITSVDYEQWVRIGMALHHATSGGASGLAMWHNWTQASEHYDAAGIDKRWHGFGKSGGQPVTVGTLIAIAKENGWVEPVSAQDVPVQGWLAAAFTGSKLVTPKTEAAIEESSNPLKGSPVDLRQIDLTRPPGFVGEVTSWINDQCLYPRENLAAMGALFAVSTISGLRYMDAEAQEMRANLALFCVADSATGKDPVLNSVRAILKTAGFSPAMYGAMKSDREIYANLMRHQAAIYTIDEIGGRLAKIAHSRKGSGAAHLDGVFETFMDVYTKSNSFHVLGGDQKEEADKALRQRMAECQKRIDENEDDSGGAALELESLRTRLAMGGELKNPFLAMLGFTTPRQFASMMTVENVETGFLGRTIMCVEPGNNPYPKDNFKKRPMPHGMAMQLMQLAGGKDFQNAPFYRVEHYGQLENVPYTPAAKDLLKELLVWTHRYTDYKTQTEGDIFSAIYRRVYEKVLKIALALGVADGEIDVEHVEWGFAAAMRDVQEKVNAVSSNDESFSKGDRLISAIMTAVGSKPGATLAVICGRSSIHGKYSREDVERSVDKLVKNGAIIRKDDKNKKTGKPLPKYYPA